MKLRMYPVGKSAVVSRCGKYRYELTRWWDRSKPMTCWVCLNPSTADDKEDDPTIRRCMGFSRLWGHGGLAVVNLFPLRSSSPQALRKVGWWTSLGELRNPSVPDNDSFIRVWATKASLVVAAWGAHGGFGDRDRKVMDYLDKLMIPVYCLEETGGGFPRHPLYVRADTVLSPYHGRPR